MSPANSDEAGLRPGDAVSGAGDRDPERADPRKPSPAAPTGRVALVLASASPRRRALLKRAGYRFEVVASCVDEDVEAGVPAEVVARSLAERKARAVAEAWSGPPALVLGADTVVALGAGAEERLLGKPADVDEARAMLTALSDSEHRVVTGICVVRTADGLVRGDHETTSVRMRPITTREVESYAASGEWRDKAGGYAIQESADAFVTALVGGGFDNVVGLPVARVGRLLAELGEAAGLDPNAST